jgi:hypothetical protein
MDRHYPTSPLHLIRQGKPLLLGRGGTRRNAIMQFGWAIDCLQHTTEGGDLITEIAEHGT